MKKGILFLFLLAVPFLGTASHIVGGEFEILYLGNYRYKVNFIMYFDEINGDQANKTQDAIINARIFRTSDGATMINVPMPFVSQTLVNYTQPSCTYGGLKTSRQFYSTTITLAPELYGDPQGYYIAWERCCRNYNDSGLLNIYSVNPALEANNPFAAGQTFYLAFPPVTKNGSPFVNSSPRLFPPLSDYGCPDRLYYTDFRGTDDDGDSLVYSLTTPYSTHSSLAYPPILPAPYPEVKWRPPFSLSNVIGGVPDLTITQNGFLTVKPSFQGLFVFAVKVEEYRANVKIGETRRDFQMLVIDGCPRAIAPKILGKKLADAAYTYDNTMNVTFDNTVADGQRCIKVQVSDEDSKLSLDGSEKVSIKAIALNFNKDVSGVLPSVTNATLINESTVEFTICFPKCPYFIGGDPVIGIVAMDDACSLPLTDTLKVSIHIDPPPNNKPRFVVPAASPVTETLNQGDIKTWPYQVVDDDGDPLIISVLTNGFALANAGMTFTTLHQTNGAADGTLTWNAFCDLYDFTKRNSFQVTVQVEDQDQCLLPGPAKEIFNLNFHLPINNKPVIDTDLTSDPNERKVVGITRRINESINFKVTGKDADNDLIVMTGKAKDFTLSNYGISIAPVPVSGNGNVMEDFSWNIACTTVDLSKKDTFDFQFIVVDKGNICRVYQADTVDVQMKVLPPLNLAPQLTITNQNTPSTVLSNNIMSSLLGNSVQLLLTGTDGDVVPAKDNLKIQLIKQTGTVEPEGFSFAPVSGTSPIQTQFSWKPDCSIFVGGVYENEYSFTFLLTDDHCLVPKLDSVTIKLKIKDLDGSDTQFIPPNFFSPNGDNINDYFAMELKDEVTGELKNILPTDNCSSKFESVRIYDRWGNQVFQSAERNFKWDAKGKDAGVYFYFLKYTGKDYRGSVSLRY